MSQYGLTRKPRDHGHVIEITQQKKNEKKAHRKISNKSKVER